MKSLILSTAALILSCNVFASDVHMVGDFLSVRSHTSTSNINSLKEGNIVLLKNYWGYYLTDNNGAVRTQARFNKEAQIWVVEENNNGYGKMFRNKETGNYLQVNSEGPFSSHITGTGAAAAFINGGENTEAESNFDYRIVFNYMESYKHPGKCIKANKTDDSTLSMVNCGYLNSSWRFEVLAEFDETQEEEQDDCSNTHDEHSLCTEAEETDNP